MAALRVFFAVLAFVAGGASNASPQAVRLVGGPADAQAPPRDLPVTPATGTGVIKGRVIDATTGRGLPRARVLLSGIVGTEPPQETTDETGGFAFANLPPGRFMIHVSRPGFLNDLNRRRTVRAMSRGYDLTAGQTRDDVVLTLERGGVITGRVVDPHGEPVEHARVSLFMMSRSSGRNPTQVRSESTNDLGEFRISRLDAGSYLLAVSAPQEGGNLEDIQLAPTYFPGVDSLDQAQPIVVERGQVAGEFEMGLRDVATTMVAGSVVDRLGAPVKSAFIQVSAAQGPGRLAAFHSGASVRPDGTFRVRLPPGEYRLEAQAPRMAAATPEASQGQGRGFARVSVGAEAVGGVTIQLGAGVAMSGRFLFEGMTPAPDPQRIGVSVSSSRDGDQCLAQRGNTTIKPDLSFVYVDLWGTCMVRSWVPGNQWVLKGIFHDGTNIAERPIEFRQGVDLKNVQIVYTDKRTELTFDVQDDRGLTTLEYVALVFPTDRTRWEGEQMRLVRVHTPPAAPFRGLSFDPAAAWGTGPGRTVDSGSMRPVRPSTMMGLPPAEYFAVAVDDVAFEDLSDPAFLSAVAERATRIALTDGEVRRLQLSRIRAPQPQR